MSSHLHISRGNFNGGYGVAVAQELVELLVWVQLPVVTPKCKEIRMNYLSKLLSKETVAEGTMAFYFEKPEGFGWKAGQSIDLTLVNPTETDGEGNMRAYSIASAPYEKNIMITTRMRDTAFKRVLKNAEVGLPVEIAGPFGDFTLHLKESRPAIMLVGGIGITPFFSMIKNATEKKLPHKIFLFYSNRRPEDTAFLKELKDLETKNQNFTFIPTMTAMEKSKVSWGGETGYITKEMIEKYVPEKENAMYYSAGPQEMVVAMRKILSEMNISDDDIRTEEFPGY
jgi:ferredoxin-NADP reductase